MMSKFDTQLVYKSCCKQVNKSFVLVICANIYTYYFWYYNIKNANFTVPVAHYDNSCMLVILDDKIFENQKNQKI